MKTSLETNISTAESSHAPGFPAPPKAICDWLARLAGEQDSSHLVGECVLQLALEIAPTQFRAHTSISRERLLSLAPRAVPTGVLGPSMCFQNRARTRCRANWTRVRSQSST